MNCCPRLYAERPSTCYQIATRKIADAYEDEGFRADELKSCEVSAIVTLFCFAHQLTVPHLLSNATELYDSFILDHRGYV